MVRASVILGFCLWLVAAVGDDEAVRCVNSVCGALDMLPPCDSGNRGRIFLVEALNVDVPYTCLKLGPDLFAWKHAIDTVAEPVAVVRPDCTAVTAGLLWYTRNAGNAPDTYALCRKGVAGIYSWNTILLGNP